MAEFEQSFNYDDIFFRDVTVAFTKQMHRAIRWLNKYEDGTEKVVSLPFYYSFTGDDRFLLDSFVDDITGVRPDLNIDPIPRGSVVLASWSRKTNEIANPNVRLEIYRDVDGIIQKVTGYYRQIPLKMTFDLTIIVSSEGDMWKCSDEILRNFHIYKYFHFEHKYMKHNCVMVMPDNHNTEISREIKGIDSSGNKTLKFSVDLHTHYFIEPSESEVVTTNKKVVFKGSMWELKTRKKKRKWLGTDANED